ncbi:MAG: formamidopyrimidine-DNA glycosylase [Deltaproteobacteria bacterium]|nr:formamidopyrimidine-DNA glycosylase [Deltaproteobacteria bacterium]
MPELPDVTVYVERLQAHLQGSVLRDVRLASPFLLRSVEPPLAAVKDRRVEGFRRLGKRIIFVLEGDHFLVLHLMVAGRLKLEPKPGAKIPGKVGLAAFDFDAHTLLLTEASTKKRASLYAVKGEAGLVAHERGGLEVMQADLQAFTAALTAKNHTLKRALTDPRIFSGIGNAYSDEILFEARLSPLKLTQRLEADEVARLFAATQACLARWTEVLRAEAGDGFPKKVTAFREDMAVHGKYRQPCPVCGTKVQRIAYAENETNYCPTCQNEGRLLKDRSLSRLLKDDWPKTVDELER